jgi:outer membrane protein OmpA-like peptidoglycan-associated protein
MKWKEMALFAALVSMVGPGDPLDAQGRRPPVSDLTEGEVTEQQLIDALRPAEAPPPELLGTARGIGLAVRPRVKCPFRKKAKSRGIAVRPQRPAVKVAAIKIYFAFNSADILPNANSTLDELGKALKADPLSLCCFQVVGHTDDVGSDAYNDRLSRMRAESVVRYLAQHYGIETDRLEALGRGERVPMEGNSTEAGRSKNRRVEIANISYGQAEM